MRYDAEKARERNEIGARMTQARRALGLTQGELAEATFYQNWFATFPISKCDCAGC